MRAIQIARATTNGRRGLQNAVVGSGRRRRIQRYREQPLSSGSAKCGFEATTIHDAETPVWQRSARKRRFVCAEDSFVASCAARSLGQFQRACSAGSPDAQTTLTRKVIVTRTPPVKFGRRSQFQVIRDNAGHCLAPLPYGTLRPLNIRSSSTFLSNQTKRRQNE